MNSFPNLLSGSRIVLSFFIFIIILMNTSSSFLLATGLFILVSATDFFDGYLARRMKTVSHMGVFLDLTADKIFVSATLVALLQLMLVPAWIVLIIISREFWVMGLRSMAAAKNTVIPAGSLGKQKTLITFAALSCLLLAKGLGSLLLLQTANIVLLIAVVWTLISGIEYTINALKKI